MMCRRRLSSLLLVASVACSSTKRPDCPDGTVERELVCRITCSTNDDCLATETCQTNACLPVADDGPAAVRLFRAIPNEIQRDGKTTLEWVTTNATSIEIKPLPGDVGVAIGSVEIAGLVADTTFEIIARGPNGDASALTTVTVVGGGEPGLRIESFTNVAGGPGGCEVVNVAWTITTRSGTNDGLTVTILDGSTVLNTSTERIGTAALNITRPTELTLKAAVGNVTAMANLGVAPGLLCALSATPAGPLLEGDTAIIEWTVRDARRIELVEAESNAPVFRRLNPPISNDGFWIVEPTPPSTRYRLMVGGPGNAQSSAEIEIPVIARPHPPAILRFDLRPAVAVPGDQSFFVDYQVDGADTIDVYVDGMPQRISDSIGTLEIPARLSHLIGLVAANNDGGVEVERLALISVDDVANNNVPERAQSLQPPKPIGSFTSWVAARGTTDGDAVTGDYFEFRLAAQVPVLRIRVIGFDTGCTDDGLFADLELNGMPIFPNAFDIDASGCPTYFYEPLASGVYQVFVDSASGAVPYVVSVDDTPPSCGDGLREGYEQCDDYNVTPGDGCSEACELEPEFSYVATEGSAMIVPGTSRTVNFFPYPNGQGDPLDAGLSPVRFSRPFPFFGRQYAGMFIHRDGVLTFRPSFSPLFIPFSLPDFNEPNPAVYAFGADLSGGAVTVVTPQVSAMVAGVEWEQSLATTSNGPTEVTARAQLFETGHVSVSIPNAGQRASFVVGVEGPLGQRASVPQSCPQTCVSKDLPANYGVAFRW